MPISTNAQKMKDLVNQMSDHEVQVDASLNLVSQNLQGPYAIKKNPKPSGPLYLFDLPQYTDHNDLQKLAELTGMSIEDCTLFVKANNAREEKDLEAILTKYNMGDLLGEGGYRRSLETDQAYCARMTRQIECLKNIMEGGSDILSIQEQPYLNIDRKRTPVFNKIMEDAGYVSVASQDRRDVGIWVKKELLVKGVKVDIPALKTLPLRGCAASVNGVLCINIHSDRAKNDEIASSLISLLQDAKNYALKQTPPLRISITGDMNLFMLEANNKAALENAGFTTEMVKGQGKMQSPSYEAFFTDKGPPHLSATLSKAAVAAAGPALASPAQPPHSLILYETTKSALPDYNILRQGNSVKNTELRDMWTSILASNKNYNPIKDLIVHAKTLPPDIQSQMLHTYLKIYKNSVGPNPQYITAVENEQRQIAPTAPQSVATPSAAAHAVAGPALSSGGAPSASALKQDFAALRAAHSSDLSGDILKALITKVCDEKRLLIGDQYRCDPVTFGVGRNDPFSQYIATSNHHILIDAKTDTLLVLDRREFPFKQIISPLKEQIVTAMLSQATTNPELQRKVDEINNPSASHGLGGGK